MAKDTEITRRPHLTLVPLPQELVEEVQANVAAAKADNTRRAYTSDWRDFANWCDEHQRRALPADATTVAAYLSALGKAGRAWNTIKRHASTISQAHKVAEHRNPLDDEKVRLVMQGMRRRKKVGRAPERRKAPLMLPELRRMVDDINKHTLTYRCRQAARDKAILLVGFGGAFRREELAQLTMDDLEWVAGKGVIITVRKSKTDQEGVGMVKALEALPPADALLCPVRALREWLDAAGIDRGPIFRRVSRNDVVGGPRAITPQVVATVVKKYARRIGLPPEPFAGHSLRTGHVTEGFARGVDPIKLQGMTGHKKLDMLLRYRRLDPFGASSSGLLKGAGKGTEP
jgi:site-specific recombinase XerD